jgi:hypothetical protein
MATSDRGATLVEAALVLPILIFLLLAVIEVGGTLKSYSGTASAVRVGSRAASVAGSDPLADRTILERIAAQARSLDSGEVELVVIWKADGPGDPVPAACLPSSTSTPNTSSVGDDGVAPDGLDACNVYVQPDASGGAFAMAEGKAPQPAEHYFGCSGPGDPEAGHRLDCDWPATSRRVLTSPRGTLDPQSTDFVGVYVRVRHDSYTGALGDGLTITDRSIALIEPQGYELS